MKATRIIAALIALALCVGSLSSCAILFGGEEYMTKEEVEALLNGRMDGQVTVEGGDNYEINIDAEGDADIVAASKGLLSAVSVYCTFKKNYSNGFGPGATITSREYSSAGAGVIYKLDKEHGDAYIITNYHVVYDANSNTENHISNNISLYLYGQEYADYAIPATYVGGSMVYDLAVLKVSGSRVLAESAAMEASFADSNKVAVLDTAIAIGNPEGEGISATVGCVNVDSEYLEMTGSDGYTSIEIRVMRVDTAVNSGNSGGGLFNRHGEVIGIVNAKMADSSVDNIGYAIPSNVARYIAENIIYYCDGTNKENVYRCLMGITVTHTNNRVVYDAESGRVHKAEDVVVETVTEGGVAYGVLQAGDIIRSISVDGTLYEVSRMYMVIDSMLNARVGSEVIISVERDGETLPLTVEITEATLTPSK